MSYQNQLMVEESDGARLALFAGHRHYPRGGAKDFRAFGSTVDELKKLYAEKGNDWSEKESCYPDPWGQIVDARTMEILWEDES